MCWCAAGQLCSVAEHYRVDMGELILIGPAPLNQDKTCVAGQSCRPPQPTALEYN